MKFIYSDGGRSNYFKGQCGDCVVRAICNATKKDYKEVYDRLNQLEKTTKLRKRERLGSSRNGIRPRISKQYIEEELGFKFYATMGIGTGTQVHLDSDELPKGTLIVRLSHHLVCVKDGVLYDTYDSTRDGNRAVYGYWIVE